MNVRILKLVLEAIMNIVERHSIDSPFDLMRAAQEINHLSLVEQLNVLSTTYQIQRNTTNKVGTISIRASNKALEHHLSTSMEGLL